MIKEFEKGSFKDPTLPLAVLVAATRWNEPPRMRHDVAKQLERFCNVVFVEFFPSQFNDHPTWEFSSDRLVVFRPKVTPVSPRLRANLPWIHASSNQRWLKEIEAGLSDLGEPLRLLFNFVYEFPEIMNLRGIAWSSYFCFDEFPKMQCRAYKRNWVKAKYQELLFQRYENNVARAASCCLTPHFPLRDKLSGINEKVHMFHHAHDFAGAIEGNPRRSSGKINVGFAGYINYRICREWLVELMNDPAIVLHLIGPKDGPELEMLNGFANMKRVDALSGKAYYNKLIEMDVLIMPYDPAINEVKILTTNSKLFQCIAATRPLVISNLVNYLQLPDGVIYRARNQKNFIEQVRRAYAEDCDKLRKLRADIAAENTWDKRGEQLHGYLREALGDRIPDLV